MDINKYHNFKNDIKIYLKEAIELFNLEFDDRIVIRINEMHENYVCLKNKNIILILNNIETFPYQDIVPHFYFENGSELISIKDELLLDLLEVDKNQYKEYCLKSYKDNINKEVFINNPNGGYHFGLFSINDLIIKYCYKLFTGEKSYTDYFAMKR